MSSRTGAALVGALALASGAHAQSVPNQLPRPLDPLAERAAEVAPPEAPVPPDPLTAGVVGTGEPAFVLRGIRLEGATAIDPAALAPLWQDLVGGPVTLAALEAVAAAVGARYRAEGYVLSQAVLPEQSVDEGVVTILVIEGFVERVRVEGKAAPAVAFAERRFAPVAASRPLRLGTLERSVLLSRDTLGGTVETVVEPSARTFGAADMTVLVEPDPIVGFAAVDNRGSRLYGDVSAAAGATLYGLLGGTEQIEIVTAGDPFSGRVGFLGGTVTWPVTALDGGWLDGARFAVGGEVSRAEPEISKVGAPQGLNQTTDEWTVGAELTVPFVRTRSESLYGRVRLDYRSSENATIFAGEETTADDELTALEAGVSWDRADRIGGITILEAYVRQGLGGSIGEVGAGAPSAEFTRGAFRLARIQRLGQGDWSVLAEAIGQAASGVLPTTERFALGNATIGRGFAPGNTAGDAGLAGRLELRRAFAWEEQAAEVYGFFDYGEVQNRRATERDIPGTETIGSVGLGARIDLSDWLSITPEIARQVSGRAVDTTDEDLETRAFIGLVARF
jgi:hemolysin activation/secretion protein